VGFGALAGVLSRRFLIGYFSPWFVAALLITHFVDARTMPGVVTHTSAGAIVAFCSGFAITTGLIIQGLDYALMRLLEGYPLLNSPRSTRLAGYLTRQQRTKYSQLEAEVTALKSLPEGVVETEFERAQRHARVTELARRLDERFPRDPNRLLPTTFGNVLRAFEMYPYDRWGFDAVVFWPRLEPVLSDGERELQGDAQAVMNFFVNSMLALVVMTCVFTYDGLRYDRTTVVDWAGRLIPLILAAGAYRFAIQAAVGWGDTVRASFDLHHRELLGLLGFRAPLSAADERDIAIRAATFLRYGNEARETPPDNWLPPAAASPVPEDDP
jgi:hypothetical protein